MASINIKLRNKANKNGLYPVIIRVVKDRKQKIITLGMSCKKKDWDNVKFQFRRSEKNFVQRNRVLLKFKEKALKIIDDFTLDGIDFTLNQFEDKFRGKSLLKTTVKKFWGDKIQDLILEGRIGTSKTYKDTLNSFFKFSRGNIVFREITPLLLDKYVTVLRSNGNTDGGIGVKMRTLRALYNDAIKKGVVKTEYYPFNIFKVSKFKSKGFKKALTRDDVRKIENLDIKENPKLTDAKNFFMFSYYVRGMNFIDMTKLKWEDIQDNKILYIRSKTKKPFAIKISEPVQVILDYYKAQNRGVKYVFPILLKDDLTPMQVHNRKTKALKVFNRKLKLIAKIQGVNGDITSYVARHSFATNLKYAGISYEVISQSMGHKDPSITRAYLKEFENETVDEAMRKLLEEPLLSYSMAS